MSDIDRKRQEYDQLHAEAREDRLALARECERTMDEGAVLSQIAEVIGQPVEYVEQIIEELKREEETVERLGDTG